MSTMTLARFKTLFWAKFDAVIPPDDSNLTIPQLNKKYPNEMDIMTSKIKRYYKIQFAFLQN